MLPTTSDIHHLTATLFVTQSKGTE